MTDTTQLPGGEPTLTKDERDSWNILAEMWGKASSVKGNPFPAVAKYLDWLEADRVRLTAERDHYEYDRDATAGELAIVREERDEAREALRTLIDATNWCQGGQHAALSVDDALNYAMALIIRWFGVGDRPL